MEIETECTGEFRVESEVTISHSASASKQLVGFQSLRVFLLLYKSEFKRGQQVVKSLSL